MSELKQSQSDTTELSKRLEAIKLENTRLNTGSDELEGELEDLRRGYAQELRTVNDKLKISNDKLMHSQEKYNQLREENKILRDDYDDLKSFVDEMNAKKMKDVVIDGSDNGDDLSELLIKVRYRFYYSFKIFRRIWLAQIPRLTLHDYPALGESNIRSIRWYICLETRLIDGIFAWKRGCLKWCFTAIWRQTSRIPDCYWTEELNVRFQQLRAT